MSEVTAADPGPDEAARKRGSSGGFRHSVKLVFGNRNLRRVQLAFVGSSIGDWAYGTAVAVWAYDVGGAKAVGIWMAIRFTLMAIAAPFTSTLADKMSRKLLMILTDLTRAVLISASALCLFLDAPPATVFILATVTSLVGTPFLVAQRSLLPTLAQRPEELTAANGTASTIESLAFFAGPALAAFLLGFTSFEVVFMVNVATFIWSMALVMGVSVSESVGSDDAEDTEDDTEESFLVEVSAGFRAIAADKGVAIVVIAICVQTVIAGASTVFTLVMADTILGTGARGVGYLDASMGVGAVAGGVWAIARAARGRLGGDLLIGVFLWSLPLILVALWPTPASCFAAIILLGLGNPLVDVNADTIVQRLTPDAVLGRVFGALEAGAIATMACGALVTPFLIEWWGLRWALVILATPVVLMALAMVPIMRRLDQTMHAPANLPLLAGVDIFAPLGAPALESLARSATEWRFAAGDVLVREGERADRFFIIESGLVEVTQTDRVLRREGPRRILRRDRPAPRRAQDRDNHRRGGHRGAGHRPR